MTYAIMRALGWESVDALYNIHTKRAVTIDGVRYWQDADAALKQLGWVR
jgi:hypothetical protein